MVRELEGSSGEQSDEPRPGGQAPVAVLIVDDKATFRKALRDLVSATPGFTLVGEAESGEEALDLIETTAPQMVIMDKRMPGIGGIEAARRIAGEHPDVVVVLITVDDDRAGIERDIEASGAAELIGKQRFGPAMLRALWARHGAGG